MAKNQAQRPEALIAAAEQGAVEPIVPTAANAGALPAWVDEAVRHQEYAEKVLGDIQMQEFLSGVDVGVPAPLMVEIPVPSVGRMVHYVAWEPMEGDVRLHAVHHAAIVTKVQAPGNPDSPLSLFVMAPGGTSSVNGAIHDEGHGAGSWHWPEYEPPFQKVAEEL